MSLDSATLIAGRYRLDRQVATDQSGEVWRGTDVELARPVAVKLLHADRGADAFSHFRAAACRAASLTHEGLVRVFDYSEPESSDPSQRAFLVMEYVEGHSLADQLRAGSVGPARTADIVAQITAALQAVHGAGLAHGDIKPEKILLSPAGAAKLFGFSGSCPTGPAAIGADLRALGVVARECLGEQNSAGGAVPSGQLDGEVAELVADLCALPSADHADATASIARRAAALRPKLAQPAAPAARLPGLSLRAGSGSPASTQPLPRLRGRAVRPSPARTGRMPAKRARVMAVRAFAVAAVGLSAAGIFGAVGLNSHGSALPADGAATAASVRVAAARLIGRPADVVRHRLQRLGLVVRIRWRPSASVSAGDVMAVRPVGLVPVHSVVVIVVSSGGSSRGTAPDAGKARIPHRHPSRSPSHPPSSQSAGPTSSPPPSASTTPAPSPSASASTTPAPSPTSTPPPSGGSPPPSSPPPANRE